MKKRPADKRRQATPTAAQLRAHPRHRGWVLLATAACLLPLLLQLSSSIALGIALCGLLVAAVSWHRPLPTWLRLLLTLALVGLVLAGMDFSIGRDTGCALLAAMLALKPGETASLRDARSLLGFALFAPFAAFLLDQGPWSLLLGVLAIAMVLVALQLLAELESGDVRQTGAWPRALGIAKLLLLGLPLALAVFWLFPRLASPLWGLPGRAQARPGLSDEMTPGRWIDLMNDDTPALRVRFFGAEPDTSQMYWRGPVLTHFDGRSWTRRGWTRSLPPAEVEHGDTVWTYELAMEPTDRRQLVALELPLAVPRDARLSLAHELLAQDPLNSVTRWRMRSSPVVAFAPELKATLRRLALQLPDGFNPRTHALARQWRREAGNDDAAIVQRALAWIRRDFSYTLATPLLGRHSVDEFLFDYQAGFCEHYSSAFVVLMRAAGIPARVVTGYVGGYRNPVGDYWLVRRSDAHAWAEVWLPGSGWTRVDPTAAIAPERIYDTLADRIPGNAGLLGALGGMTPVFNASDWLRRAWNDFVLGFDAPRQRRMLQPLGVDDLAPSRLVALLACAIGLALLWMLWLAHRQERDHDPVLRAWHRLGKRYARLGLARAPHEPASDWVARVHAARPRANTGLEALSQRFIAWRYAGADGDARIARQLAHDLRAHRP